MRAQMPELPVFPPRESLREIVTKELRAALITGRLKPGKVYSAPALADRFGVSATPVREAMLDLAKEGLVEPIRNKGFRVVELDDKDLDDCTQLRRLIEPVTLADIASHAAIEDMERWRPVAEEIVRAAADGDIPTYLDADMRFHMGVLSLSGNRLLVETVRELRHRSRLTGIPTLARLGELVPSAREHIRLLDLMVARDSAGVRRLMETHLDHVRGIWARGRADGDASPTGD